MGGGGGVEQWSQKTLPHWDMPQAGAAEMELESQNDLS